MKKKMIIAASVASAAAAGIAAYFIRKKIVSRHTENAEPVGNRHLNNTVKRVKLKTGGAPGVQQ